MQEVYEELLGQLKDNAIVGKDLKGHIPNWSRMYDKLELLSTGEQVLVLIGMALYNGHREADFADIFKLDRVNQRRVLNALALRLAEF